MQRWTAELGKLDTRHKQAEEKRQESEIRYYTIFESVPIVIGLATLDDQIIVRGNVRC